MSEELERDLRRLIEDREVTVVVGAGVSLAATGGESVASWRGLLTDGIDRVVAVKRTSVTSDWAALRHRQVDSGDPREMISAAEEITWQLGGAAGGEYPRWLRERIGNLRATRPDVIEAIHDLNALIATTNYDGLLEQVTRLQPVSWRQTREVERFLRGDITGILHLHGYWDDPESVVFRSSSYGQVVDSPHARAVLQALRTTRSMLFVGFGGGMGDPNFSELLRWSRPVFAGSAYRQYVLARADELDAFQAQHPESERIYVLAYGEKHDDLVPFLRRLRPKPRTGVEAAEDSLNPILENVRQHFEDRLKTLIQEMHEQQECNELPNPIFYKSKEYAVSKVRRGGSVKAVNILDHQEWRYKDFSNHYLSTEYLAISDNDLKVERFFVGTPEQLDSSHLIQLTELQSRRVAIRRVYIDTTVASDPIFDRDIAFHETEPPCLTEGIYENGYLIHGRISTREAVTEATQVFDRLRKYSPAPIDRSQDGRSTLFARSKDAWERLYQFPRPEGYVWDSKPSRILVDPEAETLVRILRESLDPSTNDTACNILDVGRGDGRNLKYIYDVCTRLREDKNLFNVRFNVVGVDFSEAATRLAESKLRDISPTADPPSRTRYVEARVATRDAVEDVACVSGSIDVLCCIDTFSHLHPLEIDDALVEWRRVLRPGGRLILNVYHPDDSTRAQCEDAERNRRPGSIEDGRFRLWWYEDKVYKYYTEDEIGDLLSRAEFGNIKISRKEWEDPAHPRFRPEPHMSVSLVVEAMRDGT